MTPKTRQYVYCDSGTFWQGGVIEPTQQPMKPHYYVMRVGYDGSPTVKHKTLEDAQREAERWAAQHPGESFEILQCLGVLSTVKATTYWCDGILE